MTKKFVEIYYFQSTLSYLQKVTKKFAKIYYYVLLRYLPKSDQKLCWNLLLTFWVTYLQKVTKKFARIYYFWVTYLQKVTKKLAKIYNCFFLRKLTKWQKSLRKSTISWVTYKKWQKILQDSTISQLLTYKKWRKS